MSSVKDFISNSENLMFSADIASIGSSRGSLAMKAPLPSQPRPASIYDKIGDKIKELEKEQFHVGSKMARWDELAAEKEACTKRYQLKRRRTLQVEMDGLAEEVRRIEAGEKIAEFRQATEPFVQAFQRQQFCRPQVLAMESCKSKALPSRESNVLSDYVVNIEGGAPSFDVGSRDVCSKCHVPMHLHTTISVMVCTQCGETAPFLDATASLLSYSDDSYEYCSFSYKRINHFSEWIASMQAKESTEIPQSVLDTIMQRLKDERVDTVENVTVHKIREILKKFKLRKYYEHTQLIHHRITNKPPPRLTPAQEEKIKLLFMAASAAFSRVCPPDRRNFISYSYIISRLCKLLGYSEFVGTFPSLKGRQKVEKQNALWQSICTALDWPYLESL
jgi:hypothetical protein